MACFTPASLSKSASPQTRTISLLFQTEGSVSNGLLNCAEIGSQALSKRTVAPILRNGLFILLMMIGVGVVLHDFQFKNPEGQR